MMALLSLLVAVAAASDACEDMPVSGVLPVGDEVPVDADIVVLLDQNAGGCSPSWSIEVKEDGGRVLYSDVDFSEFPDNQVRADIPELAPNTAYTVVVRDALGGPTTDWSFATGVARAVAPGDVPDIGPDAYAISARQHSRDEFDAVYSVRVEHAAVDGSLLTLEVLRPDTGDRWASASAASGEDALGQAVRLSGKSVLDPMCIEYHYRSISGELGPRGEVCAVPDLTGPRTMCSSSPHPASWWFLGLVVPVLRRRPPTALRTGRGGAFED